MHRSFQDRMQFHSGVRQALDAAWKQCSRSGLVVVTGSLYLVGELLPVVQKAVGSRKSTAGNKILR
jgi:hypothetical protein